MSTQLYDPITLARQFLFVREAQSIGQNEGQRVNAIQYWSGGKDALGTSWCAWFVTMILDICYQGDAPIPRVGSCEAIHQLATVHGWIVDSPERGDVVLSINSAGVAHHIALYISTNPNGTLLTIAGNTSEDGSSDNGDRVAEHAVNADHKVFVRVPR